MSDKELMKIKSYAVVGYAMYKKGKTKEELDALTLFEVVLLNDEFDRFIEKELMNAED